MKISICGKGGSGKSTLVTLLARQALARNLDALVVDSDESNSGLFRLLGFENPPTPLMDLVGGKQKIKEKMREKNILNESQISTNDIPPEYINRKNGLMLVGIGKILQSFEGCACPMGVLNREFLKKLKLGKDEIAFIDMEAGVEHFGRGINEAIDSVLVTVEPSFESIMVAEKIKSLACGMNKKVKAVLSKIDSKDLSLKLDIELKIRGISVAGYIPKDAEIFEACLDGRSPLRGDAFQAAGKVLDCLLSE
jgi:CO dehydrogenase maturation factor